MAQQTQQQGQQQRLTPEQLKKLQEEFEKLPPERKAEIIQQGCIFCQIAQGRVASMKLYEDSQIVAVLDIAPFTRGHTLVIPKVHAQFFFQLPEKLQQHILEITNRLSTYLVNVVKANGFNILISNGLVAGQNVPHVSVNLIPRFQDDGLSFEFERQRADKTELEKIAREVRNKFARVEEKKKEVKEKEKEEEDTIKRLAARRRLP